ncbi:serine-rich adhesin for platelets isoform X1 [Halyomorpha halys]|uniref:serine-rich adhesin for platelets isoform X1 n=2 Tax=Halyomorpha halys TaxID=286706 RepID=UPI0006D4FECF
MSMGQGQFFFLLLLVVASTAVPVSNQQRRIKRDQNSSTNGTIYKNVCVLDEQIYENGQEVPSLGPCEKCICEVPDVICSMIKCQPNSGCRILQQSGQCCPEYKCDCEYNGIVYNNGERLDKPEDPCQVCYCKGGEIMCTSITCYERDDCQPHYTAGQCCPRYDHCPVETSRASGNSVRSVNTSLYSPKREMQPWPLTKPNSLTSVSYEESSASPNIYPQTIRIVEILPTTPGSESKPSEVSVIPRIKTNDHSGSKESEEISKEVSSTVSTPEYSLSTSEVEHLLETTAETREVKSEPTTPASSSTLNPLAESVDLNTLPDSYKMSTVFPDYYHTEGNFNSVEDETTNAWNETEGSGYELLKGGIYEESSTLAPLLNSNEETASENLYTTTDLPIILVKNNKHKNEELQDKISDLPTFEAYTATEASIVSEEDNSNSTESDDDSSSECNSISLEVLNTTVRHTSNNSSEESDESDSESFEDSNEIFNTTTTIENGSNQTSSSDGPSNELSSVSIQKNNSFSENLIVTTSESEEDSTTVEPYTSTMSTTVSDMYDETSTLENKSEIVVTSEDNGTHTTMDYSETSTEPSEIYLISQIPDENKAETKRAVAGYRNLDTDIPEIDEYHYPSRDETSENYSSSKVDTTGTTPALISIPPVLNVNSLSYGEMGHQLENNTNHNASSMAKVGIYHPTKPEFASFVTVVDDKIDVSKDKNSSGSSHMLLTPNDLKKLAEILIHQKIKPVYFEMTTEIGELDSTHKVNKTSVSQKKISINGEDTTNVPNPEEGTVADSTVPLPDNAGQNLSGSHDNFNRALGNHESSSERILGEGNDSNDSTVTESSSAATTFHDIIRNFVSTVSSEQNLPKESESDDPNTSRQIRIQENPNQYSALLDDRDLVILENFFKKNMGLH